MRLGRRIGATMRVLIGVSGGIAAYKAADLASNLVKRHEVRVMMTPSATRFVGPLTFEGLTGHPVLVDALATGASSGGASAIEHIEWAKWAEVAVLAPATASTLGKLAGGIADNGLLTVWIALPPEVRQILCPAMNTKMWEHPGVQRSLRLLREDGLYTFVEPVAKRLACGDVGVGGLADVQDIVAAIEAP